MTLNTLKYRDITLHMNLKRKKYYIIRNFQNEYLATFRND